MALEINDDKDFTHRWLEDVERIQKVLLENGYSSPLSDCSGLWNDYSGSMCAGWLGLPEDDKDLWEILKDFI